MGAPTDVHPQDWQADFRDSDTNTPSGPSDVGPDLDNEIRNIKSVVREFGLSPTWVRPDLEPTRISGSVFTLPGDRTVGGSDLEDPFTHSDFPLCFIGRKVKGIHSASHHFVGTIVTATYDGTKTTVTCLGDAFGDTLASDLIEVWFGMVTIGNAVPGGYLSTYYTHFYSGNVTHSGNNYVAEVLDLIPSLLPGMVFQIKWDAVNSGPVTLKINDFAVLDVKRYRNSGFGAALADLDAGEIAPDYMGLVVYDGTQFQLINSAMAFTATEALDYFRSDPDAFDAATCVSGGWKTHLKSLVDEWCITKSIAAGQNVIQLPIQAATMVLDSIQSIQVSFVNLPLDLTGIRTLPLGTHINSPYEVVVIIGAETVPVNSQVAIHVVARVA